MDAETESLRKAILYGALVERRDGPSWLRDDDDDHQEEMK